MGEINESCEHCGADAGEVAFLKYQADPNDAQADADWFEDTAETIYSIVCTNCGIGKAALDPRENDDLPDLDELPDGTGGSSFKVEDELR